MRWEAGVGRSARLAVTLTGARSEVIVKVSTVNNMQQMGIQWLGEWFIQVELFIGVLGDKHEFL